MSGVVVVAVAVVVIADAVVVASVAVLDSVLLMFAVAVEVISGTWWYSFVHARTVGTAMISMSVLARTAAVLRTAMIFMFVLARTVAMFRTAMISKVVLAAVFPRHVRVHT